MINFLTGTTVMGCIVAVLFFFKFWKQTGDRFFFIFALSFFIFALNRAALLFFNPDNENAIPLYILRLLAFLFILIAIIDKNKASTSRD